MSYLMALQCWCGYETCAVSGNFIQNDAPVQQLERLMFTKERNTATLGQLLLLVSVSRALKMHHKTQSFLSINPALDLFHDRAPQHVSTLSPVPMLLQFLYAVATIILAVNVRAINKNAGDIHPGAITHLPKYRSRQTRRQ
jgi:hypothetical protein